MRIGADSCTTGKNPSPQSPCLYFLYFAAHTHTCIGATMCISKPPLDYLKRSVPLIHSPYRWPLGLCDKSFHGVYTCVFVITPVCVYVDKLLTVEEKFEDGKVRTKSTQQLKRVKVSPTVHQPHPSFYFSRIRPKKKQQGHVQINLQKSVIYQIYMQLFNIRRNLTHQFKSFTNSQFNLRIYLKKNL